jgi:UDP-glucose 4-epimerase
MMKVLIIGGFGYLGLNLARFLLNEGYEVSLFGRGQINFDLSKYKVHLGDVQKKEDLQKACFGIDVVIHLAALQQGSCVLNPKLANDINYGGTRNSLEVASDLGVSKFIYFSTVHVYGKLSGVITESTLTHPLTEYGVSKLKGEECCLSYKGKMKCIVLRVSNVFGLPLTEKGWNLAINNFCKQVVSKNEIKLNTKGLQKIDLIGISNINQVISILLKTSSKRIIHNLFNIGGMDTKSIKQIADIIAKIYSVISKKEVKISFPKDTLTEEIVDFTYNVDRIRELGYIPKTNFEDEIKKILKKCIDTNE